MPVKVIISGRYFEPSEVKYLEEPDAIEFITYPKLVDITEEHVEQLHQDRAH